MFFGYSILQLMIFTVMIVAGCIIFVTGLEWIGWTIPPPAKKMIWTLVAAVITIFVLILLASLVGSVGRGGGPIGILIFKGNNI